MTSDDGGFDEVATRLEQSSSVLDNLNGALVRSVSIDAADKLRVSVAKQRLLFVSRDPQALKKSYVLASFFAAETYELVLVIEGVVRRADRCGSAIRNEVLAGFLNDLIIMSSPVKDEPSEPVIEEAEVTPAPTSAPAPESSILLANGWIQPAPSELR